MTLACPTGCGACCRHAGHAREFFDPGWPFNDDGSCGHLTTDGRCGIYERRPDVCRTESMRPPMTTDVEWHEANAAACADLQANIGLDPSTLRPGFNP